MLKEQSKTYKKLVESLSNLILQTRSFVVQQINIALISNYRNIGKQIVEFEQKGKEKAKYGSGLLKKISSDLTKNIGKGFSERNIERMRNFYLLRPNLFNSKFYQKSSTVLSKSIKLNRSHYLRLMTIKDETERKFYEIECIQNNRSVRELNRQFDSALFERIVLSKDKKKIQKYLSS